MDPRGVVGGRSIEAAAMCSSVGEEYSRLPLPSETMAISWAPMRPALDSARIYRKSAAEPQLMHVAPFRAIVPESSRGGAFLGSVSTEKETPPLVTVGTT